MNVEGEDVNVLKGKIDGSAGRVGSVYVGLIRRVDWSRLRVVVWVMVRSIEFVSGNRWCGIGGCIIYMWFKLCVIDRIEGIMHHRIFHSNP